MIDDREPSAFLPPERWPRTPGGRFAGGTMARQHLEPLADGFVGFTTASGERWKHKDIEAGRIGPGYRLFISEKGEERRYSFGKAEPHDATLMDLREQLTRATRVEGSAGSESVVRPGSSSEATGRP